LNSYPLTFDWPPGARLAEAARFRQFLLLLLAAVYVFPGLVGHDPWKQDETYVTSIVAHLERTHDWIVPRSAGLPLPTLVGGLVGPTKPIRSSAQARRFRSM
jgi:hypothetical protein